MSQDSVLPKGWIRTSLETFGKLYCGQSPSVSEVNHSQKGTPYVTGPDQWDGTTLTVDKWTTNPKRQVPGGCIFITVKGAGVGTLFSGVPCAIGRDVYAYEPAKEVSRKFIEHSLRFNIQEILRHAKGDIPGLSKDHILGHLTSFPPLNEQRRIVSKIEELFSDLDAGIAALKRAKANLKRYRAAVLKAAVEGKLTEEWRAKHPNVEPASKLLERILTERRKKWEADQLAKFAAANKEPPKNWRDKYVEPLPPVTTGLPELANSWCWVTLGQLLHRIEGGKSFECLTRPAGPNEWGVVKVSAMTWGKFLEHEQKAIPPAAEFDPDDEIKPKDLLLSRSNTSQLVGATVLVGNCRPRLLLSDKSLRLRPIEIVNLEWLHTALSSSVARSQLSAMATGTSDSMRNVSQDKIKSVVLPLPPLAEQKFIVEEASERLSQIAAAEIQITHSLLRGSRLRQSILKQAFEGRLVPQDPTDEPASVLLERTRANRSTHEENGPAVGQPRGRRVKSKQLDERTDQ